MNILSYGSRGITCQVDRIEEGFCSLGHTVNKMDMSPDLIYANDIGHWDAALDAHSQFANSKCILTILDLPFHLPDDCREQIEVVKQVVRDYPEVKICTISQKVREDILKHCEYDAAVIYQPIKDITNQGVEWSQRPIEYLIVGRNHDKGKGHWDITIPCIQQMHGDISKLSTIGEGFDGAQNYGCVTDEQLNTIYNNSKYVFVCGTFDGLGLSLLESQAAGALPISYYHHPTAKEFVPKELIFNSIGDIIMFIQYKNQTLGSEFDQRFVDNFRKEKIAQNIIDVAENSS